MAPPTWPEATGPDVVSAGAVVTRKGPRGREVLLVHRPKYDDWSFPKGKQDPGEHVTATAVREVLEETGVEVRLGRPLLPQLYSVSGGRAKLVHYWVGQVMGDDDVSGYHINAEVDEVGWFGMRAATERLTYLDDINLLEQYREFRKETSALVVVRHARARKRKSWDGPEPKRPLTRVGKEQSAALIPLFHAYGICRVITSSSTRCVQTVKPYAQHQVLELQERVELTEEEFDLDAVRRLLTGLMKAPEPAVVCGHRPVLPSIFEILGVEEEPLSPGEFVVCHHRRGRLVAVERHHPR